MSYKEVKLQMRITELGQASRDEVRAKKVQSIKMVQGIKPSSSNETEKSEQGSKSSRGWAERKANSIIPENFSYSPKLSLSPFQQVPSKIQARRVVPGDERKTTNAPAFKGERKLLALWNHGEERPDNDKCGWNGEYTKMSKSVVGCMQEQWGRAGARRGLRRAQITKYLEDKIKRLLEQGQGSTSVAQTKMHFLHWGKQDQQLCLGKIST